MATKQFGAHGDALPGTRWERPPAGPDLDYSWHRHARCDGDDKAYAALQQLQQVGRRPWAPWCDPCPVKAHCMFQGKAEDADQPPMGGEKYAPMVYGGLNAAQRRNLKGKELAKWRSRLVRERHWLREQDAASA